MMTKLAGYTWSSRSSPIGRMMDVSSIVVAAGVSVDWGWQPERAMAWLRTSVGPCSGASIDAVGCVGVRRLAAVDVILLLRNIRMSVETSGDSIRILGKSICRALHVAP